MGEMEKYGTKKVSDSRQRAHRSERADISDAALAIADYVLNPHRGDTARPRQQRSAQPDDSLYQR